MSDTAQMRMERIERLLKELEYEVTRGIVEREIDETIVFRFIVPISHSIPDGQVFGEFRTRPVTRDQFFPGFDKPNLKLVSSESTRGPGR